MESVTRALIYSAGYSLSARTANHHATPQLDSNIFEVSKSSNTARTPSSIVSLGTTDSNPESHLYEAPDLNQQIRLSNDKYDAKSLTTQLENSLRNITQRKTWGSPLATMQTLIQDDTAEYQQTMELSLRPAQAPLEKLNVAQRETWDIRQHASFRLTITTASGKEVDFTYALKTGNARSESGEMYSYQELDIRFQTSDSLTEDEKQSLMEFSKRLEGFTNSFFDNPDKGPRLDALNLFEGEHIRAISLKLDGADATLRLNAEDGEQHRKIRLSWQTQLSAWQDGSKVGRSRNELQLQIDKLGSQTGHSARRDQALAHQLAIIEEQLTKGRASDQQAHHVMDAFESIHSGLSFIPTTSVPGAADSLVTGLADYQLKFEGQLEQPMLSEHVLENPRSRTADDLRGNENSRMAQGIEVFELQQTTQISSKAQLDTIEQNQNMALKASYFEALPHLQHADFEHQNFRYNEIDNQYSITTKQSVEDGAFREALIEQNIDFRHSQTDYSEGKIENQLNRNNQQSRTLDLLIPLLQLDKSQQQKFGQAIAQQIMAGSAFALY